MPTSRAKRLILSCTRQWGKSTFVALKALHRALFQPGSRVLVLSRSGDQAGLLLDMVQQFAAHLEIPVKRVRSRRFSVALPNVSRILSIAHAGKTGRGNTAD